jgi:hypothetical protein
VADRQRISESNGRRFRDRGRFFRFLNYNTIRSTQVGDQNIDATATDVFFGGGSLAQSFACLVEVTLGFPNIKSFPESHPGPYERQMGGYIVGLFRVFAGCVPDSESNSQVLELASTPGRWSAGHAVFDEVRHRLLAATKAKDEAREGQYCFEESCCQAMYNTGAARPI